MKGKKTKGFFSEFKAFISRGNVFDMAVGVVIGGAFGAIVTALVNVLLSVCTWGVPGGLNGLVTVLPAANAAQKGPVGQSFSADPGEVVSKVVEYAKASGATEVIDANSETYLQWQNALLSKYTLHGSTYIYNSSAFIDWGSIINAVISFLIIALVLFAIVKTINSLKAKKLETEAKMREEYYKKHPELRPVVEEPGAPVPTEKDILVEIRDLLKEQKK